MQICRQDEWDIRIYCNTGLKVDQEFRVTPLSSQEGCYCCTWSVGSRGFGMNKGSMNYVSAYALSDYASYKFEDISLKGLQKISMYIPENSPGFDFVQKKSNGVNWKELEVNYVPIQSQYRSG